MKLNAIFHSGMVLQAEKPVRVFGTGGGKVTVTIGDETREGDFRTPTWCVTLPALPYGGPYTLRVVLDGRERLFSDVWAGDVYLLGGQSNMQFKLAESDCRAEDYAGDPLMRLFSVEQPEGGQPYLPEDGWVPLTRENAGKWPCIGYFTGRFLRENTDHVLGFIACCQGAADIQTFLPDSAFAAEPDFLLPDEDRFDMAYPWNEGHSQLYDMMVRALIPFSMKGIVWYQGESNCAPKEAPLYGRMLRAMIGAWRKAFEDDALPFVVIQVADFEPRINAAWREIQQAQADAEKTIPFVKTVISADVCERDLIHPTHKTALSQRVARALETF